MGKLLCEIEWNGLQAASPWSRNGELTGKRREPRMDGNEEI